MLAAIGGRSVFFAEIACFVAVAGWVADQTLSGVRKLSADRRQRRRR